MSTGYLFIYAFFNFFHLSFIVFSAIAFFTWQVISFNPMNILLNLNFSICVFVWYPAIVLEVEYLHHEHELELLYVLPCFLNEFPSKGSFLKFFKLVLFFLTSETFLSIVTQKRSNWVFQYWGWGWVLSGIMKNLCWKAEDPRWKTMG